MTARYSCFLHGDHDGEKCPKCCNGKCRGFNSNSGFVVDPDCAVHGQTSPVYDDVGYMRGAEVRELRSENERLRGQLGRFEALGRAGLVVSVCFGFTPTGVRWSVDVLDYKTGDGLPRALAARDFAHCLELAETEAQARGWLG